jgi:putative transcriptional regulator
MKKVTSGLVMDDATRAALASGRAEPSMGLFIDTLLEMRGISDREGEVLAGAMLEAEAPAAMADHALDMVFAAIERGGPPPRSMRYPELESLPASLRDSIRAAEGKRGWYTAGPGIRRLTLDEAGGAKAEIIRLDAGQKVPWHSHKGQELTLCVFGEFSDSRATYGPGDFSISDVATRHQPIASKAGPAYALAVTDAGLKFEGVLGALQKLFGG